MYVGAREGNADNGDGKAVVMLAKYVTRNSDSYSTLGRKRLL